MDLNNKKLLIVRLSSLGDVILTTPLLRTVKNLFPSCRIDFVVKPQYQDVIKFNPYISNLYIYETDNRKQLINILKQNKYDVTADLQNNLRSRVITWSLNTDVYRFNKRTREKLLLVKLKKNKLKDLPPVPVRYAETLNVKLDTSGTEIFIAESVKPDLDKGNYIGFAPGSRHFTKMWPDNYFIHLGKKLVEAGYTIVLFGGKEDKAVCGRMNKLIPGSIDLSNENMLLNTLRNMKECIAVVCNDSGLMHTASAAGIPVLVFFGSTVKEFGFTPYKADNLILENNFISCRPCSHIGRNKCPLGHFNCMLELKPEIAFNKLMLLLNS